MSEYTFEESPTVFYGKPDIHDLNKITAHRALSEFFANKSTYHYSQAERAYNEQRQDAGVLPDRLGRVAQFHMGKGDEYSHKAERHYELSRRNVTILRGKFQRKGQPQNFAEDS